MALKMEIENKENSYQERLHDLSAQLEGLRHCYNIMRKHGAAIQKSLTAFEESVDKSDSEALNKSMKISENCGVFGVAAHALMNSCDSFIKAAQSELTEVYEAIRKQKIEMQHLDRMAKRKGVNFSSKLEQSESEMDLKSDVPNDDNDGSEMDNDVENNKDSLNFLRLTVRSTLHVEKPTATLREVKTEDPTDSDRGEAEVLDQNQRKRRSTIPDKPNVSFSAWNFLKNVIGKDLSKIPMPVNFNEPLTLLQRITEEFENSHLLDSAAETDDNYLQLAYVAAFTISTYSRHDFRTGKPFNPLLGETYECDRTQDMGWRSIAEQVSHHPPVSATHCEGRGWICWQHISFSSKFKGKSIQVETTGSLYCKFLKTGNTYSWGKVPTVVKNVIVGTMFLDHYGNVEIIGLGPTSGLYCELIYEPYSLLPFGPHRSVHGVIKDEQMNAHFFVKGNWDSNVDIAPVLSTETSTPERTYEAGDFTNIWTRVNFENRDEKTYYFSKFTCELNDLEDGVAPTDSRLRPDLRLMEQGLWDQSNQEKLRLEESQRSKRKDSETNQGKEPEPLWFKREIEKGKVSYKFKDSYWDAKLRQDWSECPRIF